MEANSSQNQNRTVRCSRQRPDTVRTRQSLIDAQTPIRTSIYHPLQNQTEEFPHSPHRMEQANPQRSTEACFQRLSLEDGDVSQRNPRAWVGDLQADPEMEEENLFRRFLPMPAFQIAQEPMSPSTFYPQIPMDPPRPPQRPPAARAALEYSKNATKNVGKLLLKHIWMNRNTLKESICATEEQWSTFLKEVKKWRGMNSLTRQFLVSHWHSDSSSARLFRTIACTFFRKRFRGALYASRIGSKEQYMSLVRRFLEATADPRALDSLS